MIDVKHLSRLGDAMKDLRWAARLTQTEVRDRTGMSAPQLSRYENGHETPSLESLVKYLTAVGADLCDLQRVLVEGVKTDAGLADAGRARRWAAEAERAAARTSEVPSGLSPEVARRVEASHELLRMIAEMAQPDSAFMQGIERRLRDLEAKVKAAEEAEEAEEADSES